MGRHGQIRAMTIAALDTTPPPVQLLTPLKYILSDHFRHRALCQALDQIAEISARDDQLIEAVQRFLGTDFRLHVIDEEEDLFPLIRRRAKPEDEVGSVLRNLSLEHATGRQEASLIDEALTGMMESGKRGFPALDTAARLRGFAAKERRHLIVENAIIMPMAKSLLSADDLRTLGRRMAARRGIEYPKNRDTE